MNIERFGFIWHIIPALVLSAAFTALLLWAGPITMTIALFLLLSFFFLYALGVARIMLRARRPRARPFGSGWDRDRGEWGGVREPRRPRPPYWPPRAAAAIPEDSKHHKPTSAIGYSDSPQQPLRLEDGIA